MKALKTRKPTRTTGLLALLLVVPLLFSLHGCTDLGEETFGIVTPDQFYQTDAEILAALAPLYSQFRALMWNYHNLSQVSSDENIVPTRGSDWFDGGRWLAIHKHTWDPGLTDLNGAWIDSFTGVARANGLLQTLEEAGNTDAPLLAEIRALRAFYYYTLMDLFGNIPLVGDEPGEFLVDAENPQGTEQRATVFNFIESELLAARNDLPATRDAVNFGRITKGSAEAVLASMYLNAEVFSGQARWQDALTMAEGIINSGNYQLETDWFNNFSVENANSPEHIFVLQYINTAGLGMNFAQRALHYNQITPSPWNGFATLAETYNKFSPDDARTGIFLVGRAINFETGEDAFNRQDEPLIFTPEIGNETDATEGEGVRILKFPPDPANDGGDGHGNDYPFYRLAEMYLIAAEAENELNGPTQKAIDMVNTVRARVAPPMDPACAASKDAFRDCMLDERLFELTYEAKRRQDLVRHGKFTEPWQFKTNTAPHLVLFPIPQTQLDANPNLVQNTGY